MLIYSKVSNDLVSSQQKPYQTVPMGSLIWALAVPVCLGSLISALAVLGCPKGTFLHDTALM